jgi:hypothetical protein
MEIGECKHIVRLETCCIAECIKSSNSIVDPTMPCKIERRPLDRSNTHAVEFTEFV